MNQRLLRFSSLSNVVVYLSLFIIGVLSATGNIEYGNGLGDLAYFYGIWVVLVVYLLTFLLLIKKGSSDRVMWFTGLFFLMILIYYIYSCTIGKGTV